MTCSSQLTLLQTGWLPQSFQMMSDLRAFALAPVSAWNALLLILLAPSHLSGLSSVSTPWASPVSSSLLQSPHFSHPVFSFMACIVFWVFFACILILCPAAPPGCKQNLVGRAAKYLGGRAHRKADWERWHLGCPQGGEQMCLWSYREQGVTRKINLI